MKSLFGKFIHRDEDTRATALPYYQTPGIPVHGGALILLLEHGRAQLGEFLDKLDPRLGRFGRVTFLTTSSDLRPFHKRLKTVELMPALSEVAMDIGRGPWPDFLERRWAMIIAKWRPKWQISYGLDWPDYLGQVRQLSEDCRPTGRIP